MENPIKTEAAASRSMRKIFGCLVQFLRKDVGKVFNKYCVDPEDDDKEASKAYRELLEHMELDLVKQFRAGCWVFHGVMFAVLIAILTVARAVPDVHSRAMLRIRIHSWAVLLLVVVSGWPFIQFVTLVMSEPFAWFFRTRKYTVLFVRKLKSSVDSALWFTLVLFVWFTWYRTRVVKDINAAKVLHVRAEYTHLIRTGVDEITRLLMSLAIGAVLWTLKRALFLKLRSDLHFTALSERVRQTILDFTAILFIDKRRKRWSRKPDDDPAHKASNKGVRDVDIVVVDDDREGEGERINGDAKGGVDKERWEIPWESVSKLKKETVPVWIVKKLIDHYLDYYTKMTRKKKANNDIQDRNAILRHLEETDDDEKLMNEARMMLYEVMDGPKEDDVDIDKEMLLQYGLNVNQIKQVFLLVSKTNGEPQQRVTQDQFLRWAVKAVKNCKGLKCTIESSKEVFRKLQVLMNLFVVVLTIVVWLLFSDLVTNAQIAILFAPFVSASFIFGESLKRAFDGLIFLFAVHPFDVGDRVVIDKVEMKVVGLYILKTVFTRCESGVEVTYPNYQLSGKTVINLEVEPEEFDSIEFTVPVNAPSELIRDLQIKIKKTLDDNITFTSENAVAKKRISNRNVTMTVYFKYLVAYISSETKAQHRSKVFSKIIKLRKQLKINMKRLNEMKKHMKNVIGASEDMDSKLSEEEEVDIFRFKINAKVKLVKIEERKKIVMRIIRDYDARLEGCSYALLTDLNKEKLTMEVRIWHPKGRLTNKQKDDLKRRIENRMEKEDKDQGREKQYEVSWHLKSADWDDDC